MNNNQNQYNNSNNNQNLFGNNTQSQSSNNVNSSQTQNMQTQYNNVNMNQQYGNTNTTQTQYNNVNMNQQYSNKNNNQNQYNNSNTIQIPQYNNGTSSNYSQYNNQTTNIKPEEPKVQPISNLEPLNTNKSNNSNKKILPLIIIITIVILGIVLVLSLLNNKKDSTNGTPGTSGTTTNNTNNNQNVNNKGFIKMKTSVGTMGKYFVGLTANGDLYQVGKLPYGGEEYKNATKIASNVKKFIYNNFLLYINEKSEVYYLGLGINGGTTKTFEKIFDNAKDVQTNGFSLLIVDNNNNLYAKHMPRYAKQYSMGFKEEYPTEFVKVRENVKVAYPGMWYHYYITLDNKLYLYDDGKESLVMENVKEISDYNYASNLIILDNNNTAYRYDYTTKSIVKMLDNIVKIENNYMIDKNNNAYKVDERYKETKFEKLENLKNVYFINNTKSSGTTLEAKYIGTDGKVHVSLNGQDTSYSINELKELIKG